MKKIIFYLLVVIPFFTNAEINGTGYLSTNSSYQTITGVFNGQKVTATFKMQHWGDEYEQYRYNIVTEPLLINGYIPEMTATPNSFYCGLSPEYDDYGNIVVYGQGDDISVTFEVTVPDYEGKKNLEWWVRYENPNDDSDYLDFFITIEYDDSYTESPTAIGAPSMLKISSINGNYWYEDNYNEIEMNVSNSVDVAVFGDDDTGFPSTIYSPWHWQIILYSDEGEYICKTGTSSGVQGSTWNFNISTLPIKNWLQSKDGYTKGYIKVYVDQDGYHIEASVDILVKTPPNSPHISASMSNNNVAELRYKTLGATSYMIRYKEVGNTSWIYKSMTYPSRLFPLSSGQYEFQVKAYNSYGNSGWSDSYYVYASYSLPIDVASNNIGLSNNWNVSGSDGADRTFKFNLRVKSDVSITTCFSSTDFDTKIEVFDVNGSKIGCYNDDKSCSSGGLKSTITKELPEGTYYLVVDGYAGKTGNFRVELTAIELAYTVPFMVSGSTIGENNSWNVNGSDGADMTYQFYLPENTNISATTCYSTTNYDTKIEVFDINSNRTGLYNDDGYPRCSYNSLASTASKTLSKGYYYLVVDGYAGKTGSFTVNVTKNNKKSVNLNESGFIYLEDDEDLNKYEKDKILTIDVYPNPSNNAINIQLSDATDLSYILINSTGQIISQGNKQTNFFKINSSDFSEGLYFMKLKNDKNIVTKKIMIKH